ncbi:MAG: GNAT family N-acetyltransferase [Pseudomonadota bacterium]|nr:GNAT family N-acetyltransferase [Pseudomonadota bacterium]
MPAATLRVIDSLAAVSATAWDALVGDAPLLSHAFLHALHETGCASTKTGWTPRYLTAWREGALVGAMPLYVKAHSYGEYVFDWSWADAYRRHGRRYYPKLLCAVPFTPATGRRIIAGTEALREQLLADALALLDDQRLSSLHILFPDSAESALCERSGLLVRESVQFHWTNPGFGDFDDFLAAMNHAKRKNIRQERRKLAAAGISFRRLVGREITPAHWDFFFRCYAKTYGEHHSTPYLTLEFFRRIGETLADNVLLVLGETHGKPVCAALDIFSASTLWGRYWGTQIYVPGLHFETCYYQAIEFCIERHIGLFEGGAQGMHKLARGLMPVTTRSAHAISDPDFARAIGAFLVDERSEVARTVDELERGSPFRQEA